MWSHCGFGGNGGIELSKTESNRIDRIGRKKANWNEEKKVDERTKMDGGEGNRTKSELDKRETNQTCRLTNKGEEKERERRRGREHELDGLRV